jgi:hypothetical protein
MTRFPRTLARPLVFVPGIAAAVAFGAVLALLMMPAPEAIAAVVVAPAAPLPVTVAPRIRERTCDACGFVQTIRRTDPATGSTAYEFSVRMRDGSTRDSMEATRGRWVEGDRVILIGGTAARALEEAKNAAL